MKKSLSLLGCAGALLLTLTPRSGAAVSFVFTYSDATWSAPAKAALQDAANTIASYLTSWTATVPMNVTGNNDPASATLASAGAQ